MNKVKIHFLSAAGTVTGIKFYLETPHLLKLDGQNDRNHLTSFFS